MFTDLWWCGPPLLSPGLTWGNDRCHIAAIRGGSSRKRICLAFLMKRASKTPDVKSSAASLVWSAGLTLRFTRIATHRFRFPVVAVQNKKGGARLCCRESEVVWRRAGCNGSSSRNKGTLMNSVPGRQWPSKLSVYGAFFFSSLSLIWWWLRS